MYEQVKEAIKEIQQARSRFQLERFVLGQHATEEMKYYQTCIELHALLDNLEIAEIEIKKLELKIKRLREKQDELEDLEADLLELALRNQRIALVGSQRELAHLLEIWECFDIKYTRAEIEAAQPEYWRERLTNNAKAMLMGGSGVGYAHIEAMEQAGVLDNFVAEVEKTKKELS